MVNLTDRQKILFERLVTLGDWATSGELPLAVFEIIGFGSFFRGKPRPQDVDLIIRTDSQHQPAEFDKLVGILESIRYDWDLEEKHATPREAIEGLVRSSDERLPSSSNRELQRFFNWIESYSWNMLRPQTIQGECSLKAPHDYAKRMIKKRLPNLNVVQFLGASDAVGRPTGLRCGFTVSVWSKQRSDTRSNLLKLLSQDAMLGNAERELAYFEVQQQEIAAQVALRKAEIQLLRRIPKRRKKTECSWSWFNAICKDHKELAPAKRRLERAMERTKQFCETEWGKAQRGGKKCSSLETLAMEVDHRRTEIKKLYIQNDFLELLRGDLAHFKSGAAHTKLPAEEYVTQEMLRSGSKKAKSEKAEFLREMGLPVDRVLRRMASRFPR